MIDIDREIEAVQREVGEGSVPAGVGHSVLLRREYDARIDDVWDALTNPERIGRWFLPISGDYRLGGRYQFEGNAGGEIVECDRPHRLKVTWVYGEPVLPSLQNFVVLEVSSQQGVRMGDEFLIYLPAPKREEGQPADPEIQISKAQVVRSTSHGVTAVVIGQEQPAIKEGMSARVIARMP